MTWAERSVCKTVGSAYVGSNPTPATTSETAPWLRKRSPAGRFLLVTPCIRVCHRGSMHSSGYGQIADSVRAKLAVRITARLAGPRPFCPGYLVAAARHSGQPVLFFAVLSRQAEGWPCPDPGPGRAAGPRPAPSHRDSAEGMTAAAVREPEASNRPHRAVADLENGHSQERVAGVTPENSAGSRNGRTGPAPENAACPGSTPPRRLACLPLTV